MPRKTRARSTMITRKQHAQLSRRCGRCVCGTAQGLTKPSRHFGRQASAASRACFRSKSAHPLISSTRALPRGPIRIAAFSDVVKSPGETCPRSAARPCSGAPGHEVESAADKAIFKRLCTPSSLTHRSLAWIALDPSAVRRSPGTGCCTSFGSRGHSFLAENGAREKYSSTFCLRRGFENPRRPRDSEAAIDWTSASFGIVGGGDSSASTICSARALDLDAVVASQRAAAAARAREPGVESSGTEIETKNPEVRSRVKACARLVSGPSYKGKGRGGSGAVGRGDQKRQVAPAGLRIIRSLDSSMNSSPVAL
eukprot:scaffold322242_cov30-Tisochrysis_lutea.AAC.2